MYKIKYLIILLALSFTTIQLNAQSANSPYSRFGYGEINTVTFSGSRAMGGIGVGYRSNVSINPVNPASFSKVDTMTFKFDLGASGGFNMLSSNNQHSNSFNASFDYLNLLFPISRWMGFSAGLTSFSSVNYNISQDVVDNSTGQQIVAHQTFSGSGGLTQLYAGTSVTLFNRLSLGISAQYLFGHITHNQSSVLISEIGLPASRETNLHVSDFRLRGGFQYSANIGERHNLVIGGIFENKSSLSGDFQFIDIGGGRRDTTDISAGFEFPMKYGIGFFYTYNNRISVGVDYIFQEWGSAKFNNRLGELSDVHQVNIGFEFLPDPHGTGFQRVRYRAGLSVYNSYIGQDSDFNNFTVTMGFGIPFRRNASILNIGLAYGQRGERHVNPGDNLGIRENYFKLTLSTTFVERWFQRTAIR